MCFYLRKRDVGKAPRTAKRDIVVYKFGSLRKDETFSPGIRGYYIYKPGVVQPQVLLSSRRGEIEEGYHSYINFSRAAKNGGCVAKMIIPKGSYYYFNDMEVVASCIKFDSIVASGKDRPRWKKWLNIL